MGHNKYGAVKTEVDGILFDSKAESLRYKELKVDLQMGLISDLVLQPEYPCVVNGKKVCSAIPDFRYVYPDGQVVVEDIKGVVTPIFRLKAKLVEALYGIKIQVVKM